MELRQFYEVEMSDIEGNGSFQCPECGKAISAKDESNGVYKTESWTIANGTKIIQVDLRCQCGTNIRLEGSDILAATGFASRFGGSQDPEDPEDLQDPDCWLEWLDGADERPSDSRRSRMSIPFWD